MEISFEHVYDADAATVIAMLTDRDYLQAKVNELGHGPGEVLECDPDGSGGWRLVTTRIVEIEVPGFAARFIQPTNTMKQTDEWGPDRDGVRDGSWKVEARGVPVSLSGTMRLQPRGAGSVEFINGTIKANVPLVGGKLEKLVFQGVDDNIGHELEFNRKWLASH